VLEPGPLLGAAQRWGVAIASAVAARNPRLRDFIVDEARRQLDPSLDPSVPSVGSLVDDAFAAGALMAMNNVYYRFRHLIGKPSYGDKPARLRMNRLIKPATNKVDFELFSLAVSAINGCEICIQSHEKVVIHGGLTEDQVHEAVRIAATVHAAAVALELPVE
jgi:lipoyl-dependent peroxiredoxin subunit D